MAPQELIAPDVYSIGTRAELKACEADSVHTRRVPEYYLQQNKGLLTRDKLRPKSILKELKWSESRHVPSVPQAALTGRNILI